MAQFQEKIYYDIPKVNNSKCACGDINRDGLQDIVIMGEQVDKNVSGIYINQNTHFSQMIIPEMTALSNGSISLADFNNDNFLDLFYTGSDKEGNKYSLLFKNINGNSFSKITTSFEQVNLSSHAWFDFNSDGFLDLILSGLNINNKAITKIYLNNKNENFTLYESNLANIYSSAIKPIDYNKDGWTDLLLTGKSEGAKRVCFLYKNENGNTLKKIIELDGLSNGDSEWGDINNDGFPDLVTAGYNGENYQSKIYTNNNGTLEFSQNLSIPLGGCELEWIDFDGDEDLDLLSIGGINNTSPKTVLYVNHNGIFSNSNIEFENVFSGCLAIADFNNDKKTDIFISGTQIPQGPTSTFYLNNQSFIYEKPTPPTSLNSSINYPNVVLSWNKGSDNIATPNSLQYRLKVGSAENNSNFYPFYSNLETNENLLTLGNNILNNRIELLNLPEGKYYWAVQSIDIANNTSTLSDFQYFFINTPADLGKDLNVCLNEQIQLSVEEGNYTTNWYSKSNGKIANNTNNITLPIVKDETIWVELVKDYGGIVYDTIQIFCQKPPEIDLNNYIYSCPNETITISPVTNGSAWQWKQFNGKILGSESTYSFKNTQKDSLILIVESDYKCISKDTCFINQYESPTINLDSEYYTCKNNEISIKSDDFHKIQWLNNKGEVLLENTPEFTYKVDQQHELYLSVENENACTAKQKFTLVPYPLPIAYAGKDTLLCEGVDAIVGPEILAKEGTPPYEYFWTSLNNTFSSSEMHPVYTALKSTEFILNITDHNGCTAKDSVTYTVNPKSIIDAGTDQAFCLGESVSLGSAPTAQNSLKEYTYQWVPATGLDKPNIANPVAKPAITTEYTLIVNTHNCESLIDKVKLTVHQPPVITAILDTTVGSNQPFILWAKGADSYEWTPEFPLNDAQSNNPRAIISENTEFSVIGYSDFGCQSNEFFCMVTVINDVYVPTLFTPNDDGKNDHFLVYGTGISELKIRVYDNWGKVVFSSNKVSEIQSIGWNGTINGKKSPEGSYIWELEGNYSDGRYWKKTGTIYLMR
nr:FG-GAP-like repeat-containing protein [uncultured Marinifilum sp.]